MINAIDDKQEHQLMVIWDLGRKCTFTCSYCPPHRRNNWSTTADLPELIETAKGLDRYAEIYNKHRDKPFRVSASFTGGEPTVNPAFFKFLEHLQEFYPHWKRTLTTNGFYSTRKLKTVMANTNFTTISYHCEATPNQKLQVRRNMQTMLDDNYNFKLNVMFHEQDNYFEECIELCKWCDDNDVPYTPRVIGDQGDVNAGLKQKTVHEYSEDQMSWFKRYWVAVKTTDKPAYVASSKIIPKRNSTSNTKTNIGQDIGRPCCGNRPIEVFDGEWTKSSLIPLKGYPEWSCMVNWYFLYINQEIDKVWHHQTCMVALNGKVEPICDASKLDEYCDTLETTFATGAIPLIRCPKSHCGCGRCVPKAKNDNVALAIFKSHTSGISPTFTEVEPVENYDGMLKQQVAEYDRKNPR